MTDVDITAELAAVELASSVADEVRELLSADVHGHGLGMACINAVKTQLRLFADQREEDYKSLIEMQADPANPDGQPTLARASLFDHAARAIASQLGHNMEDDSKLFEQIRSMPAIQRASQQWDRIPYVSKLQMSQLPVPALEEGMMIDQWIQRNEAYMRARLCLDTREPSKDDDGTGPRPSSEWQRFLVALGRNGDLAFGGPAADGKRTVVRPTPEKLDGLFVLDHHRKSTIELRNLDSFQETFERMTGGVLKGLDWNNILVAGGMVLAPLTALTEEDEKRAQDADIDLYLYNLTEEQGIAKLAHIEQIFKANLPEDVGFSVLRNTRTITFHPHKYPHRRVQVVLKLCLNPMEILLNFDLDQVAMGYDGKEVWMLPRCARSLVTGYTVFTMDLIHGHYLNDRRATQDQRVFKYGDRGWGLRFLFSYIVILHRRASEAEEDEKNDGEAHSAASASTERSTSAPPDGVRADSSSSEEDDDDDDDGVDIHDNALSRVLWAERERVKWYVAYAGLRDATDLISTFKHVEFDSRRGAATAEQSHRGSLGCWQSFCRHVAAWELAQKGYIRLESSPDSWSEEAYADDPLAYAESVDVRWDSSFSIDKLKKAVDKTNSHEVQIHGDNLGVLTFKTEIINSIVKSQGKTFGVCRSVLTDSVAAALEADLCVPVNIPDNLLSHCESIFPKTTFKLAVPEPHTKEVRDEFHARVDKEFQMMQANNWYPEREKRLPIYDKEYTYTMWTRRGGLFQLIDREKDELIEILHAFRYGHAHLFRALSSRDTMTVQQIGRRAVAPTTRHEIDAFTQWATRELPRHSGDYQQDDTWDMFNVPYEGLKRRFDFKDVQEVEELLDDEWWGDLGWWHTRLEESLG